MTIIEIDETPVSDTGKVASFDPVFDDDHFICCRVETGFTGATTAFCGTVVFETDVEPEEVDEVGCQACNRAANAALFRCPLGFSSCPE